MTLTSPHLTSPHLTSPHLNLKSYIADNPKLIDVPVGSFSQVEYLLLNNNYADIVFQSKTDYPTLVEIETIKKPLLGTRRLINHRAVLAEQHGLLPKQIRTVLVSPDFTEEVIEFCQSNDVLYYKITQPANWTAKIQMSIFDLEYRLIEITTHHSNRYIF